MPKLRLVVLNDFGLASGGATSLAISLAVGVAKAGIPTTYITSDGPIDEELIRAGVEVISIPGIPLSPRARLSGALPGLWRPATTRAIRRFIAESDTEETIYHLNNWGHFLSPAVFSALRPVQNRLVATTHDYFLVCPNGAQFNFNSESICNLVGGSLACSVTACDRRSFFDKVWRLGRHDLRAMTYPLASMQMRVAVIHAGMAGPLLNAGVPAERIVEIRNPIRPFVSGPRVMAERNREILFVGRLSHEKGPDLAALAASSAGLTIRFVGDGPLRPSLQAAFPNALFDGFLAREDIVKKARNARLLVLPSRWVEPFGLVTVEAMASGIPVVISKNALLADEIVASGSGFAVEPRDTASFAALLSTLATDDSRVQTASLHAIASSETIGLRLDAWISRHLDLYAEIIGTD